MSWLLDLCVVAMLIFGAWGGSRRGLILMGLELGSLAVATAIALLTYQPLGALVRSGTHVAVAVSELAAFGVVWMVTELGCAIAVRKWLLPRVPHEVHMSNHNRYGGAALGLLKYLVVADLALIVWAGLPISSGDKSVLTESTLSRAILASSAPLQNWLKTGIGRDLSASLNVVTVTADPESTERITLGFTTTSHVDPAGEEAMLTLLNHERTTRGLKALKLNTQARSVARLYSADMFARGYFSHISPEGLTPFDRMHHADIEFATAGENLALAPTIAQAHDGLMKSPGHRANILNTNYRTVGIGVMDGGPYGLMVAEDFTD